MAVRDGSWATAWLWFPTAPASAPGWRCKAGDVGIGLEMVWGRGPSVVAHQSQSGCNGCKHLFLGMRGDRTTCRTHGGSSGTWIVPARQAAPLRAGHLYGSWRGQGVLCRLRDWTARRIGIVLRSVMRGLGNPSLVFRVRFVSARSNWSGCLRTSPWTLP